MPSPYVIGAAGIAAALMIVLAGRRAAGESIGRAAGDFATGVLSGAVVGIGDGLGVPRTDLTECELAKAEGRTWDASFACPAADFLKWLWG